MYVKWSLKKIPRSLGAKSSINSKNYWIESHKNGRCTALVLTKILSPRAISKLKSALARSKMSGEIVLNSYKSDGNEPLP